MTIEQELYRRIFECGVFDKDVAAIIERVKASPENEAMITRWNDDVDDYPSAMISIAWLSAKRHALEYIDENCPQAWFRGAFEDQVSDLET